MATLMLSGGIDYDPILEMIRCIHTNEYEQLIKLCQERDDRIQSVYQQIDFFLKNNKVSENPCIQNAYGIDGLYIVPNYLSPMDLEYLSKALCKYPLTSSRSIDPKTVYYGKYWDMNTGIIQMRKTPLLLQTLLNQMQYRGISRSNENLFNQVCVTKYLPKQQRSFCIDSPNHYGSRIACLIIGDDVTINFKLGPLFKIIRIDSYSLCVLSGDARYKWCYSIKNNTTKIIYSLVYRTCLN